MEKSSFMDIKKEIFCTVSVSFFSDTSASSSSGSSFTVKNVTRFTRTANTPNTAAVPLQPIAEESATPTYPNAICTI